MPTLPFDFTAVADIRGVVHITKRIPVGLVRITITNFSLRTANGCQGRRHHLHVSVNQDTVYAGPMHDCADLRIGSEKSWRGLMELSFEADGFTPGEDVRGEGEVRFRPSLI